MYNSGYLWYCLGSRIWLNLWWSSSVDWIRSSYNSSVYNTCIEVTIIWNIDHVTSHRVSRNRASRSVTWLHLQNIVPSSSAWEQNSSALVSRDASHYVKMKNWTPCLAFGLILTSTLPFCYPIGCAGLFLHWALNITVANLDVGLHDCSLCRFDCIAYYRCVQPSVLWILYFYVYFFFTWQMIVKVRGCVLVRKLYLLYLLTPVAPPILLRTGGIW